MDTTTKIATDRETRIAAAIAQGEAHLAVERDAQQIGTQSTEGVAKGPARAKRKTGTTAERQIAHQARLDATAAIAAQAKADRMAAHEARNAEAKEAAAAAKAETVELAKAA